MIVLYTVLAIILVLLVVLLLNVAVCTRKARALEGQHPTFTDAELESYGKTFSRMLQCATVSVKDSYDDTEFAKLRQVVEEDFPLLHQKAERRILSDDCWLYKIPGKDPSRNILLMSHHDVVPADTDWTMPAFDGIIRDGKADLVEMARSWICDSDYGKKLYEGRGEDITPCVRCNKCHVPNDTDKFRSFCSVNPLIGLEDKIDRMIAPVEKEKKVGVVGGGPAGMYAAITLADRGHKVTLYEKEAKLGGQLSHADLVSFKWPLADYKDFLARQCEKKGVDIRLNTEATKEMLEAENFDHVILAIGPVFTKANIPGADSPKVLSTMDAYHEDVELPENIVIIGGSETGVETGMYLCDKGHKVTVLCRQKSLASDAPHAHYVTMLEDAWLQREQFNWVKGIQKYVSIDDTGVNYINFEGKEKHIDCDCVIMCTGARPNTEGCTALYGAAPKTDFVGDCFRVGNVHFAVTTAFGAANQI